MDGVKKIQCQLTGVRPLMFDRYAGDNNTSLPPQEKMYLTTERHLIVPALNLFSLLAAENTKSVCNLFFGKSRQQIALGIASYVGIDPFEIPLLGNQGEPIIFRGWNSQIYLHHAVARVKKGRGAVPMSKERPTVALPWRLEFEMSYQENKSCTLENLRQALTVGGTLGLGTFRPYFGRYQLTKFEVD